MELSKGKLSENSTAARESSLWQILFGFEGFENKSWKKLFEKKKYFFHLKKGMVGWSVGLVHFSR